MEELPVKFRESLINNFSRNINYTITQLYMDNKTEDKKIELLNRIIDRIKGYEGDIILKYNKLVIFRFLNNINNYMKNNNTENNTYSVINDIIEKHKYFLITKLNE